MVKVIDLQKRNKNSGKKITFEKFKIQLFRKEERLYFFLLSDILAIEPQQGDLNDKEER